jgi:hypothetical protein
MTHTAALIVLLAAPLVSAPPPKLIREIDLNQIILARHGFTPSATFAFSPDENWVAVAVGTHPLDRRNPHQNVDQGSESLLLVRLNGTADQTVQIQPGLRPVGSPVWSPNSAAILVQGFAHNTNKYTAGIVKLWDLKGDELLHLDGPGFSEDQPVGGIFGFLDPEHLLARRIPAKGAPAAFETVNLQGQVVDTWTVPKHWTVVDISPDRGLLAVLPKQAPKTLIVDATSKKVVLAKDNPHGYLGYEGGAWQYFTEGGKTLCSVGSVGTGNPQFDTATECWDVDSGKKIAQFEGFPGGAPAAASPQGSRLVLTRDLAFPRRGVGLVYPLGERVAWDFRSGIEIAAWDAPQIVWTNASHIYDSVAMSSSDSVGALFRIYELP